MSNIKTDYALFDVVDYKGESKLSSYNLDITPLTFKARIPEEKGTDIPLNDQKVTFDFGDGTFGHNVSSTHVYEYPGEYTVRMIIRDCKNNSVLASYSTPVQIHDYIINTFTVDLQNLNLNLSAGEFSTPLTVNAQTPFYQDFQDIFYSISGCDFKNYFNLPKNRFNSLEKYFSIYEKYYLPTLSSYEYVELEKISLSSTDIYARINSDGLLVHGLSSSLSSVYVGSSGVKEIFVKTDDQDDPLNISFFKDRNNIFANSLKGYKNNNYTNNFNISLSSLVGATSAQALSVIKFTSNGIAGESIEQEPFAVSKTQYKDLGIPFVLSPVSNDNYTMKALSAGNPIFTLLSGDVENTTEAYQSALSIPTSYYSISSLANTLSSIDTNFWYRGVLTFDDSFNSEISGSPIRLFLSAGNQYSFNTNSQLLSTVTGTTVISAYPKNYYEFYKHNENFDFERTIKDLRFQEILLDKNIFFDDFIGTIFGDVSSRYDILGKKLYEKIFNFVSNNADIDLCDISSLISMAGMTDDYGIVFDRSLAQEPAEVKRFLDILSVNYNKFRGGKNKFEENFDPKGTTTKATYGKNLGEEINSLTYEITAGNDLVAYEKYSNTYLRLNTFQPLSALSAVNTGTGAKNSNTYMLSDYSTEVSNASLSGGNSWGWGLILPSTYTINTVNNFYDFYSLSAVYDDTVLSGLIDYENGLTTVSFSDPLSSLEGENNIFDIIIRNSLFSSLSLF